MPPQKKRSDVSNYLKTTFVVLIVVLATTTATSSILGTQRSNHFTQHNTSTAPKQTQPDNQKPSAPPDPTASNENLTFTKREIDPVEGVFLFPKNSMIETQCEQSWEQYQKKIGTELPIEIQNAIAGIGNKKLEVAAVQEFVTFVNNTAAALFPAAEQAKNFYPNVEGNPQNMREKLDELNETWEKTLDTRNDTIPNFEFVTLLRLFDEFLIAIPIGAIIPNDTCKEMWETLAI